MTAIVATVGPATKSLEMQRNIFEAGADVFRFSASKQSPGELAADAAALREMLERDGRDAEIYLDLPGSKTRLTNDGGFRLNGVSTLRIHYDPRPARQDGNTAHLGLVAPAAALEVAIGDVLVIGDGEDAMMVTQLGPDWCDCRPLTDGVLGHRRGVTIDGKPQPHVSLTRYDLDGLKVACVGPFSGVILSFTDDTQTIHRARAILNADGRRAAKIIAKIETRRGLENLDDIAANADAILLGRGDMLLDAGIQDYYETEKQVIERTLALGTPLIVGTELFVSLSRQWMPSRSELSCLCRLLEQGVHGLLLSQETTIGKDPYRTVTLIDSLRRRYGTRFNRRLFEPRP